jgi:Cu/Zn superoxide dismutase
VILHAGADNFANIPLGAGATQYTANSTDASAATAKTGNAGDRIACGVITG